MILSQMQLVNSLVISYFRRAKGKSYMYPPLGLGLGLELGLGLGIGLELGYIWNSLRAKGKCKHCKELNKSHTCIILLFDLKINFFDQPLT